MSSILVKESRRLARPDCATCADAKEQHAGDQIVYRDGFEARGVGGRECLSALFSFAFTIGKLRASYSIESPCAPGVETHLWG